ncbi:Fc.00g048520.m01.CDS01 [Cosmosporella sp. VM-42]
MADVLEAAATPTVMHGVASRGQSTPGADDSIETSTNTAADRNVGTVVARIETILETIFDSFSGRDELTIDFMPRRNARRGSSENRDEQIRFPGRTIQEARKFARVLLILQLAHDALVSGTILTKRHIYYQHQHLFENQRQVDDLVDDVACTLGINRGDLNIVAASKGVLAGPLTIRLVDGSLLDPNSGEQGVPIPTAWSISAVELSTIRWILVIEKDAVFRSLCSSQFWHTSAFGPGILITVCYAVSFYYLVDKANRT